MANDRYVLPNVLCHFQRKFISVRCRNEKIQLFSCWTYGVRDGVGGCPSSLNYDLCVLFSVDSYALCGSKFFWEFGQEHFQQNRKIKILNSVFLSY